MDHFLVLYNQAAFCFMFFLHFFSPPEIHNPDVSLNVDAHAENTENTHKTLLVGMC